MVKEESNAYEKVASDLRERILGGELKAQEKLPTEEELSEEFRVSRITIRRALDILSEEHLIRKKHGKGSFVSPAPVRRIPLLIDYARSVRTHAPNIRRKLRLWKWSPAPEGVAEELEIEAGNLVYYCERVDILGSTHVAYDRAYIAPAFADNLREEDLERVDFNEIWQERCRFRIVTCKQIVEAASSDENTSRILETEPAAPVLEGIEIYFTTGGRPAGLFDNFYHPHYISLVSNFRWGES